MPKIPFSIRRSGRYYFRRRVRFQNGKDFTIVVPLSTCNGQEARERATGLAAQFDRVRRTVNAFYESNRELDADTLKSLFETELRHCLATFVSEFHDPSRDPLARIADHRTHASAYDIAQRPGTTNELTDAQRQTLAAAGHDDWDIELVACDLDRTCGKDTMDEETLALVAEGLGIEPTDAVIGRLRHIHLAARAEAHRLAAHFFDEDVQSAFDQEAALLAKRRRNGEPLTFAPPAPATPQPAALPSPASAVVAPVASGRDDCLFKTYHTAKFSEVIPKILRLARAAGHWNRGLAQYERVLRTFAWVTGDKPLGEYDHSDVAKFKNALLEMPRTYRPTKDFERPFDEVVATLKVSPANARSVNTIKRDLSYMSTAYQILAEDEWAPKAANTKALDFGAVKFGKHKKVSEKTERPAWTPEHMQCLFSAPIWTGGGGHLRRLNAGAGTAVYHDAAYWLPMLLYYTHATLNEIAGLRTDEVHIDDAVPNLVIKNNDLRAEDGVDGGEKNIKRGRMIPLHDEILRLGFAEYVQAIRAEGHTALFPELYLNEARIGGHQFRNIAWGHMRDWIGLHMPIPVNVMSGKQADMHSIRSLGSSFYATSEAPDLMRADVMGHARTGTNALHYSKRTKTHGVDKVLAEYKAFMARWTDVATGHLQPHSIKLLPINHRSRTGKPRKRI
jgi:integrase